MPKLRIVQPQPDDNLTGFPESPSQIPKSLTPIDSQNAGTVIGRDVLDPVDDRFPFQEEVKPLVFRSRVPIRRAIPNVGKQALGRAQGDVCPKIQVGSRSHRLRRLRFANVNPSRS
jgi:hypothetical protein